MSEAPASGRRDPIALLSRILLGLAGASAVLAFLATAPLPRILGAAGALILLALAGATHMFSLARTPDRRGPDPAAAVVERDPAS